jgi:mannose-6-phosphate isomerase-like protein (cupin superfamily)
MNQTTIDAGRFDVAKIAATLPETATTLLVDHYLTNREAASARVFRVYKPTPPHYHATCDEYLYVFSGRGTFWMEDESTSAEFGPGELLFFKRGTVHAQPKILEDPVVFLSIDTPRRDPKDIVFVNPEDAHLKASLGPIGNICSFSSMGAPKAKAATETNAELLSAEGLPLEDFTYKQTLRF